MRSERCFTLIVTSTAVTPDLIRGRYDGSDIPQSAFNPKLIDVLERVFRNC